MPKRTIIIASALAVLVAGIATAVVILRVRAAREAARTSALEAGGESGALENASSSNPASGSGAPPKGILPVEQDGPLSLSESAQRDEDGDGLADAEERNLGTDPKRKDTDTDGLEDGEEVSEYCTDPLKPMTDGKTRDEAWAEARIKEAETAGQRAVFCVE